MKSWKTKNGYEILKLLSGRSNAYCIVLNDTLVLVDTGTKSSARKLTKALIKLTNTGRKFQFLILTHSHFDHCQNTQHLVKQYNCLVFSGKAEQTYAQRGNSPLPAGTNSFSKIIASIGQKLNLKRFNYDAFSPDILIDAPINLLQYGLNIRIIPTYGHSPGSISIIVDEEIAIVGDTLFGVFRNSVMPPFADHLPKLIQSWKILLATECSHFLPGHGNSISRQLLQINYNNRTKGNAITFAP